MSDNKVNTTVGIERPTVQAYKEALWYKKFCENKLCECRFKQSQLLDNPDMWIPYNVETIS